MKVGNHNQSDFITGHANKFWNKNDVFTIDQMRDEMDMCDKLEKFYEWANFLDKFFKDLPADFPNTYYFVFEGGKVSMRRT